METELANLLAEVEQRYPVKVNEYCRKLAERSAAVSRLYLPDPRELEDLGLSSDGLAEREQSPVPKLIRRYTDRAVVLTTTECFVRCRFCFRKRLWADGAEHFHLADPELDAICTFLEGHPEVTDILLSGGDPLVLSDERLLEIAKRIRSAGGVETVRICSRAPAVQPSRITEKLVSGLAAIDGIWFVTHFEHPDELTAEAEHACRLLVSRGVPVLNQTVLLAGVNDNAEVLRKLFKHLAALRVKPHYLFHIDPIEGVSHFATGIGKGLEIMNEFRATLSSIATPSFAIDLPEGGGKVILTPDCRREDGAYLSSVSGKYIRHPLVDRNSEETKC